MPPNPPSNAHDFAMRSFATCKFLNLKKILGPPLPNPGDAPSWHVIRFVVDLHGHVSAGAVDNVTDPDRCNPKVLSSIPVGGKGFPGFSKKV